MSGSLMRIVERSAVDPDCPDGVDLRDPGIREKAIEMLWNDPRVRREFATEAVLRAYVTGLADGAVRRVTGDRSLPRE